MATTCKACGAPILFIRTPGGKKMPVDAEPVPYWKKAGAPGKVVLWNGEIVSMCEFEGDLQKAAGTGYRPHWASCTHAFDFKRRA